MVPRYKARLNAEPEGSIALSLLLASLAATPTPTPVPELDESIVTPGPVGFLVMLGVAVITILLILDMTRRIRRTRYRGELRERLEREQDDTRPEE